MPFHQGDVPGQRFAATTVGQRKEIAEDIAGELTSVDQVRVRQNGIRSSQNFHLDSQPIDRVNMWKVDIQFKSSVKGPLKGMTVGQVWVSPSTPNDAIALVELKFAINQSVADGHIWIWVPG